MTLTDAGPLVALIDSGDADYRACAGALNSISLPLVTTWAAFTEAMYLLGRAAGHPAQSALWQLVERGRLQLADLTPTAIERSATLMAKYADLPMDLADATLVALAEERNETLIFTLDTDFQVYRIHGRKRFVIVPDQPGSRR